MGGRSRFADPDHVDDPPAPGARHPALGVCVGETEAGARAPLTSLCTAAINYSPVRPANPARVSMTGASRP